MRDLTPVILQAGLREALSEGGTLEAECVEEASKQGNIWQGSWRIHLCLRDQRALLVLSRNLDPREFKTITGLISFGHELGFSVVPVPLRQGVRAAWYKDEEPGGRP